MHPSVELEESDGRDVGDACVVQFQYSDYKHTQHYLVNNSKLKPYIYKPMFRHTIPLKVQPSSSRHLKTVAIDKEKPFSVNILWSW